MKVKVNRKDNRNEHVINADKVIKTIEVNRAICDYVARSEKSCTSIENVIETYELLVDFCGSEQMKSLLGL